MKRNLSAALAALSLLPLSWPAHAEPQPEISIVGGQFAATPYNNERDMKPLNTLAPMQLNLLAVMGSPIVTIDDKASASGLRLTDNSGKAIPGEIEVWPFFKFSADHHAVLVDLHFKQMLPAGVTQAKLMGTLHLATAEGKGTERSKPVPIATPATLSLGGIAMKLQQGKLNQWYADKYQMKLELSGGDALDRIAKVRFFDTAGKPIDASKGGRSSMGFAGNHQITQSYLLKSKPGKLVVEVDYWKGLKQHQVPFDLTLRRPF